MFSKNQVNIGAFDMVESVNAIKAQAEISGLKGESKVFSTSEDAEKSIFSSVDVSKESIEELENKLKATKENNGVILSAWNNLKEAVNLGSSVDKCDKAIDDYKNGKISFEDASKELDKYGERQKKSLDLFGNITAGVGALAVVAGVAATVASGGTLAPVTIGLIGAGAGAVGKAGLKLADRATNKVDNDALDAKQIVKDGLSGAVTGALSALTPGTGAGSFAANGAKQCAINSAKTGVVTGAIAGASNYSIDCAFEKDVDFNAGDLVKNTVAGAAVGATVGVFMGGTNGALRSAGKLTAADTDIAANCVSSAGYKVTGDRVRALKDAAA